MKMKAILTALMLSCASPVLADMYVMNVLYNDALSSSVVVPGIEDPWTTPITMTNTAGTFNVFCVDFFDAFYVGATYNMVQ